MPRLPGAESVQRVQTARPGAVPRVGNLSGGSFADLGDAAVKFASEMGAAEKRIKDRDAGIARVQADGELDEYSLGTFDAYDKTGNFGVSGKPEEFGEKIRLKKAEILDRFKTQFGKERALEAEAVLEHRTNVWADRASRRSIAIRDDSVALLSGSQLNSYATRVQKGENPIEVLREGVRWLEGDAAGGVPGNRDVFRPEQEADYRNKLAKTVWSARFDRLIRTEQYDEAEDLMGTPMVQQFLDEGTASRISERIYVARREAEKRAQEPVKRGEMAREDYEKLSPAEKLMFHGVVKEKKATGAEKGKEKTEEAAAILGKKPEDLTPEERARLAGTEEKKPFISIVERGANKFFETLGAKDAEAVQKMENDAQSAMRNKVEIRRMKAAMESGRFTTGVFADTRQFIARLGEFAGVDTTKGDWGKLIGDAATADTLDAASNRLGVEVADKLSRFTNMSLQFIRDSLPNLTRTPEGNSVLLEVMERASDRELKIASLADRYISEFKALRPEGERSFFQAVRDLDETDPVIDDNLRQRIIEGSKTAPPSFKQIFGYLQNKPPEGVTVPKGWVFDSFDNAGRMIMRSTRDEQKKVRTKTPVIDPKTGKAVAKPAEKPAETPTEEPAP